MSKENSNEQPGDDILDALHVLENNGYAWAVFSPAELEDADPDHCRDAMISAGWDFIANPR